jgi:hypothetical protein
VARGIPRYHSVILRGCNHFPVENQQRAERMIPVGDCLVGQLIAPLDVGDMLDHVDAANQRTCWARQVSAKQLRETVDAPSVWPTRY